MTNRPIQALLGFSMLAICSCDHSSTARANQLRLGTSIGMPIVYEAIGARPNSDDGRIDFDRLHPDIQGIHITVSSINSTAMERSRSETGGIATFVETDKFVSLDVVRLYAPKPNVRNWTDRDMECELREREVGKSQINCRWSNGTTYSSLYSSVRGVEWFDAACGLYSSRICRYVLRSKIGVLSEDMLAHLRSTKGIERR